MKGIKIKNEEVVVEQKSRKIKPMPMAFMGHERVDLDLIGAIYFNMYPLTGLDIEKMLKILKTNKYWGLKNGNEPIVNRFSNMVLVDRGHGPSDHHGKKNGETSSSLTVKNSGIEITRPIEKLLGLIGRHDLHGDTLPCDISCAVKALQRKEGISDQERIEMGLRFIHYALVFAENTIERDNEWVQSHIVSFLQGKNLVPPTMERYMNQLGNPRFNRLFDIVEIGGGYRLLNGKEMAEKFLHEILELIYLDAVKFFDPQMTKDIELTEQITIRRVKIAFGKSEGVKFNVRLRRQFGVDVIVQRKKDKHTHIFFQKGGEAHEGIIENIISIIRLEECLIRNRAIPRIDLRREEIVIGIPEWYFYKGEPRGKEEGGRFIFNGSLTASDVPVSKIPWGTLKYIIQKAVQYTNLNWSRWKTERMAYYYNRA